MVDLEIAIKLFMALLLGAVIGIEREWHKRIADIRTNVFLHSPLSTLPGMSSVGSVAFVAQGGI